MFPRLEFLEWIEGKPKKAEYDLGSSELGQHHEGVMPKPLRDLEAPERELDEMVAEEYGETVGPENVLITAGATHANFVSESTALSLSPGSKSSQVLVEDPGYEPLVKTPQGLGAKVKRFERPESENHGLLPEKVKESITDNTSLVTVTNRHNPSGRIVGLNRLKRIKEVAEEYEAHLLVDEVYGPFVEKPGKGAFGGVTAADLIDEGSEQNVVVTNSFTKFHGFGELSVGWIVANEEFIQEARCPLMNLPCVSKTSAEIAKRVVHNTRQLETEMRELLRENHSLLSSFVEENPSIEGKVHDGCTFSYVEHRELDGDELSERCWENGILVIPGRFFGDRNKIRLCASRENAAESLEAFRKVLEDID